MARCPKCDNEYTDKEEICPHCGTILTDSADKQPDPADEPVFFASMPNGLETEMFKARLESAQIPFYVRPHRSKGLLRVYMGPSNLGADFYVSASRLEEAKAAIYLENEEGAASQGPENDEPPVQLPAEEDKTPKQKLWLNLLTLLAIVLALVAFFSFDALLQLIRKLLGM